MTQSDIFDLAKRYGFTIPDSITDNFSVVEEKLWKQSQLVTAALIRALIQDYYSYKKSQRGNVEDFGWRNRYRIHILSGRRLSQRSVYNRMGVIELLVRNDFIEKREATSRWGDQDYHYRLNLDFLPKAPTLLESIKLFIEGSDE